MECESACCPSVALDNASAASISFVLSSFRSDDQVSIASTGSTTRAEKNTTMKNNYLLGKRKRPMFKHPIVTAVQEESPDPHGPPCKFYHVCSTAYFS